MPDKLDPTKPHPLAPAGSLTIEEEREAWNRRLREHDQLVAHEHRLNHVVTQVDVIFELISKDMIPSLSEFKTSMGGVVMSQEDSTTAIKALESRVSRLEQTDAKLQALVKTDAEIASRVAKLEVTEPRPNVAMVPGRTYNHVVSAVIAAVVSFAVWLLSRIVGR